MTENSVRDDKRVEIGMRRVVLGFARVGFAIAIAASLLASAGAATRAQSVIGGRGDRYVFVPVLTRSDVATPVPAAGPQPVYGLLGELEAVTGGRYAFTLHATNGVSYALVGQNAAIEQQLEGLAAAQPPAQVKIWGAVQPAERSEGLPVIVVSGMLRSALAVAPPVTPAVTPAVTAVVMTPVVRVTPVAPNATIRFDRVNLRAGPSQSYAVVGNAVIGQVCTVTGRNRAQTWWAVRCANGLQGWIDARLVAVQGNTTQIPVVDVARLPAELPVARVTPTPAPTAPAFRFWKTSLFANSSLSGTPVAMADVQDISFDWGSGSPSSLLPGDGFSLRFERTINFAPGYYQFTIQADDGVRVWLDNALLLDEWHGASANIFTASRTLTGPHDLRVDYYEASGQANLRFAYEVFSEAPVWDAAYYRGTGLEGQPIQVQKEPRAQAPLDHQWALDSPAPSGLGADFWSARWVGQFWFAGGDYRFRVRADDGVRVYVDGQRVLDYWYDGTKEVSNRFSSIGQGLHTIRVDYYDRSGAAYVRVWWEWEPPESGPR